MQIWFVFSLILSAVITIFAVLNATVVTINLFWIDYDLSLSIVILISAAFGAIITIFLGIFNKIKTSLKIRELKSELVSANHKIEIQHTNLKTYQDKIIELEQKTESNESINTDSLAE